MVHPDLQRPTWAEIDLDALAQNLHSIRDFIGEGIKVMGVVKANAYGHGAVECSKRLEAEGIDWLGVAIVEEAIELREAGISSRSSASAAFGVARATAFLTEITRCSTLNKGRLMQPHVRLV
jgi:alanine racemase